VTGAAAQELYLEVCKKYQVDPGEFWSARRLVL